VSSGALLPFQFTPTANRKSILMDKTQVVDPSTGSEVLHHVDPVLDPSQQHHHTHHNHTARAEEGRKDEVVYSQAGEFEKGIVPEPTPLDHASKSSDEEAGENYPAQRTWYRRVGKQWRHIVYAVIWLLFTG
jgi:CNT family concentrative nucleoside transporter